MNKYDRQIKHLLGEDGDRKMLIDIETCNDAEVLIHSQKTDVILNNLATKLKVPAVDLPHAVEMLIKSVETLRSKKF